MNKAFCSGVDAAMTNVMRANQKIDSDDTTHSDMSVFYCIANANGMGPWSDGYRYGIYLAASLIRNMERLADDLARERISRLI